MLEDVGFRVSGTSDFFQAKRWIAERKPDLLVSDVRLGQYNGLHLVIWGRAFCPGFRSLLIDSRSDAVIVEDAASNGAAYVVSPERSQLLALTTQILGSGR